MFADFERAYANLVMEVIMDGEKRLTRNAITRSLFGKVLTIEMEGKTLPILQGRKDFYRGVFGEFAALVRGPKHVDDFKAWGCNYWDKWADKDGNLVLDYGNAWFEAGQVERLKYALAAVPTDRRMIINGWVPGHLLDLSLPCCHYSYQFYVREDGHLDMLWIQRSADLMLGVPADIKLAYVWLITLANEFGYVPGRVTMTFGDTHVYESHVKNALIYCERVLHTDVAFMKRPAYKLTSEIGKPFEKFEPNDIKVAPFDSFGPLEFKLYE